MNETTPSLLGLSPVAGKELQAWGCVPAISVKPPPPAVAQGDIRNFTTRLHQSRRAHRETQILPQDRHAFGLSIQVGPHRNGGPYYGARTMTEAACAAE